MVGEVDDSRGQPYVGHDSNGHNHMIADMILACKQ